MISRLNKTNDGDHSGDAGNKGFDVGQNVAHHKPGFDEGETREREAGGDHTFRRSKRSDVPQETLAARISKLKKGE